MDGFNLVDERERAINFKKKNEIMIAVFGDDYSGNTMQEGLIEDQAMAGISVRKQLWKSRYEE